MDYNKVQISSMVKGAYKKLKSFYFYDKTLIYIKKKIALFESDNKEFTGALSRLTDAIHNEDTAFFDKLISKMDFLVFPKSLMSCKSSGSAIISNTDHNKSIEKINFFIDVPVELLVVDCLWMLMIAKITQENFFENKYSYAGKFKKTIFMSGNSDLWSGIDFESNRCYQPYFENYSKWQSDAINTIKQRVNSENLAMLTLDLKSFYYSVRFDFSSLSNKLLNDSRLDEIVFLTNQIEKLYLSYTMKVSKYKKGIDTRNNATIFPIGLLSPVVLRELYLYKFDSDMVNVLEPLHYGRYVDDILIVVKTSVSSNQIDEDYVVRLLSEKGLISKKDDKGNHFFKNFPNILIQKRKMNCFYFERNNSNVLLDIIKQMESNSSEANLLPDFDIIKSNFNEIAYFYNSIGGSNKIRDIDIIQSNNYAASRSVTSLKQLIKNTKINLPDKQKIEKFIRDILEFYRDSSSIEYMASWTSIFELLIQFKSLSNDRSKQNFLANSFYFNILNFIQELNFDMLDEGEVYLHKNKALLNRLKRNLVDRLNTSISLAMALDYSWSTKRKQVENKKLAIEFRKSNMFNHHMVTFPLLNYLPFVQLKDISLISIHESNWSTLLNSNLDTSQLRWSPRFIHLDEFFIFQFMVATQRVNGCATDYNKIDVLHDYYIYYNGLARYVHNKVAQQIIQPIGDHKVQLIDVSIPNEVNGKYLVGLANTIVKETDALESLRNPSHKLSIKDKERLFRMINTAKLEGANYLTFPEFFIPVLWMKDVATFAKNNNMVVVAGLRYISNGKRAFNFTTIIQPCNINRFRNVVILFREKNYYAPEEKMYLNRLGYSVKDQDTPSYFVVHASYMDYSSILCYEFTDINSRAILKSQIDVLFVPQLNRDTNYFSSIVEATARDLHCFIVQANTSTYGDSRITGPYDTIHKNIIQVKGGINDIVIVGKIELDNLKRFRIAYLDAMETSQGYCHNCSKLRRCTYPDYFLPCKKCHYNIEKNYIKGVPPNFVIQD